MKTVEFSEDKVHNGLYSSYYGDEMVARLDCDYGYGEWGNPAKVVHMEELTYNEQKAYVKKLWEEDPKKYYEWKELCIKLNQLPELFGTRDNPKEIDESKL